MPLLIAGPGIKNEGAEIYFPAISNDLYLTVMDLAGIELSGEAPADGLSLLPALEDKDFIPGRKDLFWHFPHYHGSTWTPGSAVRSGDWKLIRFYEEEISELYNLAEDPGEAHNLVMSNPEKAMELEEKLDRWLTEVNAQMPSVNSEQ